MRPFLFMAGEFAVTQPVVFKRDWTHTMVPKRLEWMRDSVTGNILNMVHRTGILEDLHGFIYFCRAENYQTELLNLDFIRTSGRPCWPDANTLLRLSSRHGTLRMCYDAGLVDHNVIFADHEEALTTAKVNGFCGTTFVLKTGQAHCGEDKYLIKPGDEIPVFEDVATLEPFFEGESCRILLIGEKAFGVKYWNDTSWIKNSAGADMAVWNDWPKEMEAHARTVAALCKLEIAGVDYIIEPSGKFHFLEINQYPGLNISDESAAAAREFLNLRMIDIEAEATSKMLLP